MRHVFNILRLRGVFQRIYSVQLILLTNILRQSQIECAPSHIRLHAIYGCMSLWVTEEDQIGRDADLLAIDLE